MSSLHALHQERLDLRCTNEEELRLDSTRISTLADRASSLALIGESDNICCKELTEAHTSTWGNTQSGVAHVVLVSFGARVIVPLYFHK
jgi:hypothetical protein